MGVVVTFENVARNVVENQVYTGPVSHRCELCYVLAGLSNAQSLSRFAEG